MKKRLFFISMFLILGVIGVFCYKKYFPFPKSEKEIMQRREKIFEARVKEYENSSSGKIDLTKSINIRWRIKEFKAVNHDIKYCKNEYQDAKYICEIDGAKWFGSDLKTELPKNKLTNLTIYIDKKHIQLDISQMFNPNFTGELNADQFKIKQFKDHYILYGFFSDGGGSYTAHWKIENGKSERIILSQEDKDFEWQNF